MSYERISTHLLSPDKVLIDKSILPDKNSFSDLAPEQIREKVVDVLTGPVQARLKALLVVEDQPKSITEAIVYRYPAIVELFLDITDLEQQTLFLVDESGELATRAQLHLRSLDDIQGAVAGTYRLYVFCGELGARTPLDSVPVCTRLLKRSGETSNVSTRPRSALLGSHSFIRELGAPIREIDEATYFVVQGFVAAFKESAIGLSPKELAQLFELIWQAGIGDSKKADLIASAPVPRPLANSKQVSLTDKTGGAPGKGFKRDRFAVEAARGILGVLTREGGWQLAREAACKEGIKVNFTFSPNPNFTLDPASPLAKWHDANLRPPLEFAKRQLLLEQKYAEKIKAYRDKYGVRRWALKWDRARGHLVLLAFVPGKSRPQELPNIFAFWSKDGTKKALALRQLCEQHYPRVKRAGE